MNASVELREIQPDERIPENALHSIDGHIFLPMLNPEDTIGRKASEFTRKFYVFTSAFKLENE